MLHYKLLILTLLLATGELLLNYTLFAYLRRHFKVALSSEEKLFGINISIFKGILERMLLMLALVLGFSQMLVVFGALKLGTRIDDKSVKVNNDYFLVGNLFTLMAVFVYWWIYQQLVLALHV